MPAYKNDNGTWYVSFYYRDMNGSNTKKKKTGFETRREALNWERQFLAERSGAIEMTFGEFVEVYKKDMDLCQYIGHKKLNFFMPPE